MPELKCGVVKCKYHYNFRCSKSAIKVTGTNAASEKDTNCESFREKDRLGKDHYNLEIGTIDDIISDHLSVNCEVANCTYNRNLLCYAKDIKIDGTSASKSSETFCSTFLQV